MTKPLLATVSAMLALATSAAAQSPAVNIDWSWTEVEANTNNPVATPNGILEPGEGVLLQLSVSLDPPVGTSYPLPNHPSAVVAGLHTAAVTLGGTFLSNFSPPPGQFSHRSFRPEWFDVQSNLGTYMHSSAVVYAIEVAQLTSPGQTVNPENPIENVWSTVWTPSEYRSDTIRFRSSWVGPAGGSLWLQTGIDPQTGAPVYWPLYMYTVPHGQAIIPMVPAPGAATVTLAGLALLSRRRRR